MIEWISVKDKKVPGECPVLVCDERDGFVSILKDDSSPLESKIWITHWAHINKPEKKRWLPEEGEEFWLILDNCVVPSIWHKAYCYYREGFGVYKTKDEAEAMLNKMKSMVTEEIGAV